MGLELVGPTTAAVTIADPEIPVGTELGCSSDSVAVLAESPAAAAGPAEVPTAGPVLVKTAVMAVLGWTAVKRGKESGTLWLPTSSSSEGDAGERGDAIVSGDAAVCGDATVSGEVAASEDAVMKEDPEMPLR